MRDRVIEIVRAYLDRNDIYRDDNCIVDEESGDTIYLITPVDGEFLKMVNPSGMELLRIYMPQHDWI